MSTKHGSHWLEREDFGSVIVVRLKTPKTLDEDTIRAVFEPIYSLIGEMGRNQLILSLDAVEHLSSLSVGKLVMLNRKVPATNGRLALCQLTLAVLKILEST
jgi:anti-anti-sigma factor